MNNIPKEYWNLNKFQTCLRLHVLDFKYLDLSENGSNENNQFNGNIIEVFIRSSNDDIFDFETRTPDGDIVSNMTYRAILQIKQIAQMAL